MIEFIMISGDAQSDAKRRSISWNHYGVKVKKDLSTDALDVLANEALDQIDESEK